MNVKKIVCEKHFSHQIGCKFKKKMYEYFNRWFPWVRTFYRNKSL